MFSNSFHQFKPFYFWLVLFCGFMTMGAPSCTNEKKTDEIKSCLTLTKEQLKSWIPAYSNPGNPVDNMISAVSFLPAYDPTTKSYSVIARAFNSKGIQLGNDLALNADKDCEIAKLEERIYQYSFTELQIVDPGTGDFISNFEQLFLEPKSELLGTTEVLKFELAAVAGGGTTERPPVLPCPPCANCRLPCPPPAECFGGPPCNPVTNPYDTAVERSATDTMSKAK